ncbi:MAG: response regulator [Deltaproteobacteria bacterium]|nr:MAG: response regulator [Deltaproteobacteria bacterium]
MSGHILIGEYQNEVIALLRGAIENIGFQTTVVKDGRSVLKAIEEKRPDLCLIEILLPRLGGATLCREIKARADLPVVLLNTLSKHRRNPAQVAQSMGRTPTSRSRSRCGSCSRRSADSFLVRHTGRPISSPVPGSWLRRPCRS